jgi:AraC-like DNA-binding protein
MPSSPGSIRYTPYDLRLGEPGHHRGLPGPTVTIVVAVGQPLDVQWEGDAGSRSARWACISGLHTAPAIIRHDGTLVGVQLDLTVAACRRVLGLPAGALRGELVDATTSWGPSWLRELPAVLDASGPEQWDAIVRCHVRRAVLECRRTTPGPVEHALDLLAHGASVAATAAAVGYSRRRLSTLVQAETGLDPRTFRRVARFDRARRRVMGAVARTGAAPLLADVAAESGFSDHAHLSREWTSLAGLSPSEWLREEFPILQASATLDGAGW